MNIEIKLYLRIILLVLLSNSNSYSASLQSMNVKRKKMVTDVWCDYVNYWQSKDNYTKANFGDNEKELEELENKLTVQLPVVLKESLQTNFHFSRRGRDSLRYSWFGDLIEINFLSSKMIIEEYNNSIQEIEINDLKSIYIGEIALYEQKGWPNYWVPILTRNDVDIIVFLDLREGLNSQYGQVLAIVPYAETEDEGYHNRIAFVAKSYLEFMEESLEYIKANNGLDNKYFSKLFDLSLSYWN